MTKSEHSLLYEMNNIVQKIMTNTGSSLPDQSGKVMVTIGS
jgi:hypothetical protein